VPRRTPIGPGTKVILYFSIRLDTGELVDSTGDKPAVFMVGDGNLLPGFEQAIFGLTAGTSTSVAVTAEQGFGPAREENVQMMKSSDFDKDIKLTEGLMISFADQQKSELPGVVKRVLGDVVEVDFNHPLAGRDIVFEVEIVSVEQVSNEIARG
jgi:FKBP-type peptidyl-prolyl cis-trans isomerase SlpA